MAVPAGFPANGEFFTGKSGGVTYFALRANGKWWSISTGTGHRGAIVMAALRQAYGAPKPVHPNFDIKKVAKAGVVDDLIGWQNINKVGGPSGVGIPGGFELWQGDDKRLYVVYDDPRSGAPMLFHIRDRDALDTLGLSGTRIHRKVTRAQLQQLGAWTVGTSDLLRSPSFNPLGNELLSWTGATFGDRQVVRANDGSTWLLDRSTMTRHRIPGEGTLAGAVTLYGEVIERSPQGRDVILAGWREGVDANTLFGGPGGVEQIIAGAKPDPFTGEFFGDEIVPTDPEEFDFDSAARLMFPWMPEELLGVYSEAWAETGDPVMALAEMRAHGSYDSYFAGNRRPDGSFRHSEQEWFAVRSGYDWWLHQFGVNPEVIPEELKTGLMEGETSPDEFGARLNRVHGDLLHWGGAGVNGYSAAAQWYAENYGLELTEPAILLSALDAQLGRDVLDRRIDAAKIGGSAEAFGFARSAADVQRLQGLMDPNQAYELYAQAGRGLPTLQALARRHGAPGQRQLGIGEFEEAAVLQDPSRIRQFERNLASEQSMFAGQSRFREREEGGLGGLRPR